MTEATTVLTLHNGRQVILSADMVRAAAKRMPAGDGQMLEVIVDGRHLEAIPLLALVADCEQTELSVGQIVEITERLGFSMPPGARIAPRRAIGKSEDWPRDVSRKLYRMRGKWVAIREGSVVASSEHFHELLPQLSDLEVEVVFVPLHTGFSAGPHR